MPILEKRYRSKDVEISLTRLDVEIASAISRNIQRRSDLIRLRRQIEEELASYFSRLSYPTICSLEPVG
jgi:hypothetical protein